MEVFEYIGNGQRVLRDVVSVRFHPSVIEVEKEAFSKCVKLKEVAFNKGLKKIGAGAFSDCTMLQSITIPTTVDEISECAFKDCSQLREVVFNDGLKKIAAMAFRNCPSLQRIELPSTLTKIGCHAFRFCTNLREVDLHEGLMKICDMAFASCYALGSITLPYTLTEIAMFAFENCRNLREVRLREGLQKIGEVAFRNCSSLQSIILPTTLIEIGRHAFYNCIDLREVGLHEKLQKIDGVFIYCSSLERFSFPSISTRLNNVIEVETEVNRTRQLNEIDAFRGDLIERRDSELLVLGPVIRGARAMARGNWNTIKASLDQIVIWIRYHEIKEATTLFELALWKARIVQVEENSNRDACRIDVPGPVKDAILQYLR